MQASNSCERPKSPADDYHTESAAVLDEQAIARQQRIDFISALIAGDEFVEYQAEAERAAAAAWDRAARDKQRRLDAFVARHKGLKQRDPAWYAMVGRTVGGSELAAINGLNFFSSFADVVGAKLDTLAGRERESGGPACWWGTIFEDVLAVVVGDDLGAPVVGDDICIQRFQGYRNSPDGYVVARLRSVFSTSASSASPTARPRGRSRGVFPLWGSDEDVALQGAPVTLVLEFKCPFSRRPGGGVPKYYAPQVQSGLALSPVADRGLFVDAVFRKCALDMLPAAGEAADGKAAVADGRYDVKYHAQDSAGKAGPRSWGEPFAWGVIEYYADQPAAADATTAASAAVDATTAAFAAPFIDLGAATPDVFNNFMEKVCAGGVYRPRILPPCFCDRQVPTTAAENSPAGVLVAVLPWKLFEMNYHLVDREPGFLRTYLPLIRKVHTAIEDALASDDLPAFMRTLRLEAMGCTRQQMPDANAEQPEDIRPMGDVLPVDDTRPASPFELPGMPRPDTPPVELLPGSPAGDGMRTAEPLCV